LNHSEPLVPLRLPVAVPAATAAEIARGVRRRYPDADLLVLAPSDSTGWFAGTHIVAWADPGEALGPCTLASAARELEAAESGRAPVLTAVVLSYEGEAQTRVFRAGLTLTAEGWRPWGHAQGDDLGAITRDPFLPPTPLLLEPTAEMSGTEFVAAVEFTREQIAAGNVYVANITYRIRGSRSLPPLDAFVALTTHTAAPMSALLIAGDRALVSASPERFLGITEGPDGSRVAEIWPIKGTRPRGTDSRSDARLARELSRDDKERAEHVMIVDLERNDLGRVCVAGSVSVEPLARVFQTPYCHQMVSCVRGVLVPGVPSHEVFAACFPCGSVTGAPKVAAMRHIERTEVSPRDAYCGTLAVAAPGAVDSSVLIRTLEVRGDEAAWGVGGGITYDSDPDAEWEETLLKASPALGRQGRNGTRAHAGPSHAG